MDFSMLLIKFVIFIVLMFLGYYYARKKIIGPDFAKSGSKLTMDVFMSASVINSVLVNPPQLSGGELALTLLILSIGLSLSYIVSAVLVRVLPGKRKDAAVLELLMAVPNTMFIGLPVIQEVLGSEAVFYVALSSLPFNLFLYSYGVLRLKGGKGAKINFKDFFCIPLLATVVSTVIFLLRIDMPLVVDELVSTMSAATMPLSMLVIGASLGSIKPADAFRSKHAYLVSAARLIICPLVVYFVMGLFISDPMLLFTLTILSGCPSAVVVSVLAIQYGHDAVYASKGVLLSTVFSMLTIPVMAYLLVGI